MVGKGTSEASVHRVPEIVHYSYFQKMKKLTSYDLLGLSEVHVVLDMRNSYTCSFTEFLPFCNKLYYFSALKAFPGFAPRRMFEVLRHSF